MNRSPFESKKNDSYQKQIHTQRLMEEAAAKRRAELETKKKDAEAMNFASDQAYPSLGQSQVKPVNKPLLNFKATVEAAARVVEVRPNDELVSLSVAMAYKPPVKKLFQPIDFAAYMSEEEEEEEENDDEYINTRRRGDNGIW